MAARAGGLSESIGRAARLPPGNSGKCEFSLTVNVRLTSTSGVQLGLRSSSVSSPLSSASELVADGPSSSHSSSHCAAPASSSEHDVSTSSSLHTASSLNAAAATGLCSAAVRLAAFLGRSRRGVVPGYVTARCKYTLFAVVVLRPYICSHVSFSSLVVIDSALSRDTQCSRAIAREPRRCCCAPSAAAAPAAPGEGRATVATCARPAAAPAAPAPRRVCVDGAGGVSIGAVPPATRCKPAATLRTSYPSSYTIRHCRSEVPIARWVPCRSAELHASSPARTASMCLQRTCRAPPTPDTLSAGMQCRPPTC